MTNVFRCLNSRAVARGAAVAVLAVVALTLRNPISAQNSDPPLLAYPLLLNREQVIARVAAFNDRLPYIPGEFLVKFRSGSTPSEQARALTVLRGGVPVGQSRWIGEILHLRAPLEQNAEAAADVLARQPEVEWVQPNYLSRLKAVPNDTNYSLQWNMNAINMPTAWDISNGGKSTVTIAVIDSGVTTTTASYVFPLWSGSRIFNYSLPFARNPDIAASRVGLSRDFVFWQGPVLDMNGHGSHVAGTVLQETNNNFGAAGIAYNARLMTLKACFGYWELQIYISSLGIPGFVDPDETGACDTAAAVGAIRYAADNGAQVINLSFGGIGASPAYLDAIRYAVQRGAFVAIAVGNEFEEGNPIEYPAAYAPQIEGVMSVGAVGLSRRRAYYSNTGSHLEIVAPGGDVRDGGSNGLIYQVAPFKADFDPSTIIVPRFNRYEAVASQGTSMASPHIAGVAALLYAQGITNPAAIEAAIKAFAVDLGPKGRDNEFGAGLVDARTALRGIGASR